MTIIEKEEEGVSLAGERGGVAKGSLACFILWGGEGVIFITNFHYLFNFYCKLCVR